MVENTEALLVEIFDGDSHKIIPLGGVQGLPADTLQDYYCCDNILALLYSKCCVFFNWKKSEILNTEKVYCYSIQVIYNFYPGKVVRTNMRNKKREY